MTNANYHIDAIDWAQWQPNMLATLMFIRRADEVLLIHKKTGLGQGKINGPGGKIDPGETPEQAIIREVQEEVEIDVLNPTERGILHFQFLSGLALKCHVFSATQFNGTPTETREAKPFWSHINEIPYQSMWADDQFWLPAMLLGHNIEGMFIFDDDRMVDMRVRTIAQTAIPA